MEYKKSKERREKILEVAKKLFFEIGFKKTTMRNIAKKGELNCALPYYYFKSKSDLAHAIINEFHEKTEHAFNEYLETHGGIEDPFLRLLVLYRFALREIYTNEKEFEFYVAVYQDSYYDPDLIRNCIHILEYHGYEIDIKRVNISVLSTSSSWGHMYTNEDIPYLENFTHDDILDSLDIMRWVYLGFTRDEILDKIRCANEILETLPLMNIRIFDETVCESDA